MPRPYSTLRDDLKQANLDTIIRLSIAAEFREDPAAADHVRRMSHVTGLLATAMGLPPKQVDLIRFAAPMHDVGKIGIPEIILNKPEGLNDEEYGLVKSHSQKGFDILKPIEQISGSLPGILHHHERYDGKGYPKCLKGQDIPLIARIISVADTFDALTSNRAYRPGISTQVAFEKMEQVSGRQLDPDLWNLFRKVYQDLDDTKCSNS